MFRSFLNCLSQEEVDALRQECRLLFTAQSRQGADAKYSSGDTFWWPADGSTPCRWAMERFAQAVFQEHTRGLDFDAGNSGAEYWPLVIETDADVGPHYDKDYGAEDESADFYPSFGTVTYLANAHGAPTIFLANTEEEPLPAQILRGYVSKVVEGKHVLFDGKLLHCASSKLSSSAAKLWMPSHVNVSKERITLLVNIWLNHRPSDPIICPLEPPVLAEKSGKSSFSLLRPEALHLVLASTSREGVHVKMALDGKRELRLLLPADEIFASQSSSVEIEFSNDSAALEKRKKKGKKGNGDKQKKKKKKSGGGKGKKKK